MADTESNFKERADDLDGEETNLIDVADVSEVLTEEQAAAAAERRKKLKIDYSKNEPSFSKMPVTSEATIAKLSDRFAAYLIDTTILFYIYLAAAYIYRRVLFGSWTGPLPVFGFHGLVFNGSFAVIAFLYYFVLEGIFFATLGKAVCGLVIRRSDGGLASMLAIFSRNIFRVVDYQLCNFVGLIFMEMTRSSQRLGDIVAGTTVLKKGRQAKEPYHVSISNIASASGRTIAFLIDMAIFAGICAGFLLFLTPDRKLIGQWILLTLPLLAILYFTLLETMTETTPGKLIFGYLITFEDGNRLTFSASIVRTLLRPIDLIIGLAPMALSPKKQRIGDLCAGTIVTRQRRSIKGLIGLGLALALSAGTIALGWQTPKNIRTADFEFSFLPDIGVNWGPFVSGQKQYKQMAIRNFRFAVGATKNIRTPAVYSPGEKAYILFEVVGYQRDKRKVWLQEDLTVRYPDLTIGLKQDNMIDYNKVVKSDAPIELVNEIALPATAAPGRYNVTVTVRDILGGKQVSEQIPFTVRLPLPETQPVPPPLGGETPVTAVPTAPVGIPALPTGPVSPVPVEQTPPAVPAVPSAPAVITTPSVPAVVAPAIPPSSITQPATGLTPPAVQPATPSPLPIMPTPSAIPPASAPTTPQALPAAPSAAMPLQPGLPPAAIPAPPSPAATPPGIPSTGISPAPATPAPQGAVPPSLPAASTPASTAITAVPQAEPAQLSPKGPTITPLAPATTETLKAPASSTVKTEQPPVMPQQRSMIQGAEIKVPISETPLTTLTPSTTAPGPAVPIPASPVAQPALQPQSPAQAPAQPAPSLPVTPPTTAPAPVPPAAAAPQPVPPAVTPPQTPVVPATPPPTATAPMVAPTIPATPVPAPALTPPPTPAPSLPTPATPPPAPALTPPIPAAQPKAATPPPAPAAQPAKPATPPAATTSKETQKPAVAPAAKPEEKKPVAPIPTPTAEKKPSAPAPKVEEKKPAAPAPAKPVITAPPLKPEATPTPAIAPQKTEKPKSVQKESLAKAPSATPPQAPMTPTATEPEAASKASAVSPDKPKAEVKGSASPSADKPPSPESRSLDLDY